MYYTPLKLGAQLDLGFERGGVGEMLLKWKRHRDFNALGFEVGPFTDY